MKIAYVYDVTPCIWERSASCIYRSEDGASRRASRLTYKILVHQTRERNSTVVSTATLSHTPLQKY
jgi:hypothetical protein